MSIETDYAPRLGRPGSGVVVTGGASGIGLATAHALAAVGRAVALWDINMDGAESASADISAQYGVKAGAFALDLRDPQAIAPAAIATREAIGGVGGIAHCAGTAIQTGLDGVTPDNWDGGIALHARAVVQLAQAFRNDLRAHPGSAIVALSSINATFGNGMIPIYSAAKGAVISLVRALADELAADGVRINAVSPGFIDTPILGDLRDAMVATFGKRVFLARFGEPHEIGRLIRFLLSEEASYITAEEIVADGGLLHSQRP
jgi:NAD(P)-dependent dehydrogenase (short-subunit alcohol dehydrogenase family)